ncbi:putative Ig domain-containing protein [Leucobacter sp. UT-8R-CII-1-4]|uniref:leucine-rich repeat domain-containing protein n=1 Tax=Leucobacter sp. UT-8R-CII-1-4 TaxID=3040075 RepID=UPI0024A9ED22|nr:leucine-rich repeat domain-containing protein [Leucobacter sp. UT-8R-CII-1-4]MDI6023295.1 putative Ig domain-containing protein [Leucobacter sp. UT-8R-CII-1-4]
MTSPIKKTSTLRKSGAAGLAAGLLLTVGGANMAVAAPGDNVDFGNQADLKVCIVDELGFAPGSEVTEADMAGLEALDCSGGSITDISVLTLAPALNYLELSNVGLADITPLAGLTDLIQLFLSGNNISDLTPLSSLTSMIELDLRENQILDISPLLPLTELDGLSLTDQEITGYLAEPGVTYPSPVIGLDGERLPLVVTEGDGTVAGTNITWNTEGLGEVSWHGPYTVGNTTTQFQGFLEYTVREHHEIELSGTPTEGTVGKPYNYALTLVGTPSEPTVSVTSGALPAGLALSPEGIISGTPTTAGTFTFTITASNGVADDVLKEFTIAVKDAAVTPPSDNKEKLANTGAGSPLWTIGAATLALLAGTAAALAARRKNS